MTLTLSSTSFNEGETIPDKHHMSEAYGFGCSGGNTSPELHWEGVPEGTKSIVIQCFDPDAPTGSGFWHWIVTNIAPDISSIPEGGKIEDSLETRTDIGAPGWVGPCPPEGHGEHRYVFTVFALNTGAIEVPRDASAALIGFMLNANVLAKAELTATFGRE